MSNVKSSSRPGDEDRHGTILAICIVDTTLAIIIVALRMITRIGLARKLGWDDWTILGAIAGHIGGLVIVMTEIHYGFGRHHSYLTEWEYMEFLKFSYGEWIQTFQTLMFTKLSICFLLLRIPVQTYFLRPLQGAVVLLIVSNIILTFVWIFQCNPIRGAWNKHIPATCFTDAQLLRIIISQAVISIISDVVLAISPLVILWRVQMEWRIKAGLCVLMGLGVITAACCIVRTVLNGQNVTDDVSWDSVTNWYWRSWEVTIGIIAACVPTLRPGYRIVVSNINTFVSRRSSRKPSTNTFNEFGPSSKSASSLPALPFSKHLLNRPEQSYDPTLDNAARVNLVEEGRAQRYVDVEDGFAMQFLPSDQKNHRGGIQRTTIKMNDHNVADSQRSLNAEKVQRGTFFV